jgi:RND family efflux transporter MFP subunit
MVLLEHEKFFERHDENGSQILRGEEAARGREGAFFNRRHGSGSVWTAFFALFVGGVIGFFAQSHFDGKIWASTLSQEQPQPQEQHSQAPVVVLRAVESANLAMEREYIGRVEAIQVVTVKPQIAAEITQVHFKEGSQVKVGDLLFSLDDRQFRATVDLRKADLNRAEANYQRALKYYERLKSADKRSVSPSDMEAAESEMKQSRAGVEQAKAALKLAQLDLEHTKIKSPIAGKIGKTEFTKGNYVSPSSLALVDIVQVDPVRVAFALPDKDYLTQLSTFKLSPENPVSETTLRLPDGTVYPFGGERDFENNVMDASTGTIMMRLRFKNDKELLVPGSMVRVAVKPLQSHVSPVVPQEAILSDNEGDYVYIVGDDKIAKMRRILTRSEFGNMKEVIEGLQAGENIVVQGVQSIRPNLPVNPVESRAGEELQTPANRARESGYDTIPNASSHSSRSRL